MKTIYTLLILAYSSCQNPTQDKSFDAIEYAALTRGRSIEYSVINKTFTAINNRVDTLTVTLSSSQYKTLSKIVRNIDLVTLDKVKVPSKKHQFDGALIASLRIKSKGKYYHSPSFDHGNSPKELTALITFLESFKP